MEEEDEGKEGGETGKWDRVRLVTDGWDRRERAVSRGAAREKRAGSRVGRIEGGHGPIE